MSAEWMGAIAETGALALSVLLVIVANSKARKRNSDLLIETITAQFEKRFKAHEEGEEKLFASRADFEALRGAIETRTTLLNDEMRELRRELRRAEFTFRRRSKSDHARQAGARSEEE